MMGMEARFLITVLAPRFPSSATIRVKCGVDENALSRKPSKSVILSTYYAFPTITGKLLSFCSLTSRDTHGSQGAGELMR